MLPLFYLFIIINGFLSISFEILAIRLFTPFFGAGTEQTSIIIGIVLLFYSVGNFYSHYHLDPIRLLKRNVFIAMFFHGIVLNYPVLKFLRELLEQVGIQNYHAQLVVLSFLSLAPLAFIYGQNLPSLLDLDSKKKSNFILGFGTIGSFLGSVLTAVLLVYFLPASSMVTLSALASFFLAILLYRNSRIILGLLILICTIWINQVWNKSLLQAESGVATYEVTKIKQYKALIVNGSKYSSIIGDNNEMASYIQAIHDLLLSDQDPKDVLNLGAAGFSLSANNRHHRYTYVDIDPKMKQIVKEIYNPEAQGEFIHSDARAYLIRETKKFDVIIQDVNHGTAQIPLHLLTQEHFKVVRERLKDDGYFVINLLHDDLLFRSEHAANVLTTLNSIFNHCYQVPPVGFKLHFKLPWYQTVVICNKAGVSGKIIRDDDYQK